jgi:hypothetical protein
MIENPVSGDGGDDPGVISDGVANGGPFLEATIPACASLNPAQIPPITTFEWQTIDGAEDPDSVRWILLSTHYFNDSWDETLDYIRDNPDAPEWFPWKAYDPSNDTCTSWTTYPLDYGPYVFAVHGWDVDTTACQSFDFGRNAVRALVSARSTGPILTVTSDFVGPIVSATFSTPVTIVNLQAGTPAEFCWTVDASATSGLLRMMAARFAR